MSMQVSPHNVGTTICKINSNVQSCRDYMVVLFRMCHAIRSEVSGTCWF